MVPFFNGCLTVRSVGRTHSSHSLSVRGRGAGTWHHTARKNVYSSSSSTARASAPSSHCVAPKNLSVRISSSWNLSSRPPRLLNLCGGRAMSTQQGEFANWNRMPHHCTFFMFMQNKFAQPKAFAPHSATTTTSEKTANGVSVSRRAARRRIAKARCPRSCATCQKKRTDHPVWRQPCQRSRTCSHHVERIIRIPGIPTLSDNFAVRRFAGPTGGCPAKRRTAKFLINDCSHERLFPHSKNDSGPTLSKISLAFLRFGIPG